MDLAKWEIGCRLSDGTVATVVVNRFGVVSRVSPHALTFGPYNVLDVDGFVRTEEDLQDGQPRWPIEVVLRDDLDVDGLSLVVVDEDRNVIVTTAIAIARPIRVG